MLLRSGVSILPWIIIRETAIASYTRSSHFVPATLKCSFGTTGPLLRDGEGLFHSLELVLTAKQRDTRWKRQLQWEDRPVRPGISINNHVDYGNKTTKKERQTLHVWVFPNLDSGLY
jgi:hypothetical protein